MDGWTESIWDTRCLIQQKPSETRNGMTICEITYPTLVLQNGMVRVCNPSWMAQHMFDSMSFLRTPQVAAWPPAWKPWHPKRRVKMTYLRFHSRWYLQQLHVNCIDWKSEYQKLLATKCRMATPCHTHHSAEESGSQSRYWHLGSSSTTLTAPWRYPTHSGCHCSKDVVSRMGCQLDDLSSSHTWCWEHVSNHLKRYYKISFNLATIG